MSKEKNIYKLQFYCPVEIYNSSKEDIECIFDMTIINIDFFDKLKIISAFFNELEAKEYFVKYLSSAMLNPPWKCFPHHETTSIFFRQGIGQAYTDYWFSFIKQFDGNYIQNIVNEFPPNPDWIEYLEFRKLR